MVRLPSPGLHYEPWPVPGKCAGTRPAYHVGEAGRIGREESTEGADSLEPGHVVTASDLEECCEKQRVSVEPGCVALVRTGNGCYWEDSGSYLAGPGMAASASYWLADRKVIAVGADNMAWNAPGLKDPELGCTLPGHLILLARRSIYIIENLMLEELAAARAYHFEVVCTPLKLAGATDSPVRPVALVSGSIQDG